MGPCLKFSSSYKVDTTRHFFPTVPLDNWRAYRVTPAGLILITEDFYIFNVYNLSSQRFHEIIQNCEVFECKYKYYITALACITCFGGGVIDWVDKVTGISRAKETNSEMPYKIDKNESVRTMYSWYLSNPHKKSGDEICAQCKGTGLHAFTHPHLSESLIRGELKYGQNILQK